MKVIRHFTARHNNESRELVDIKSAAMRFPTHYETL